MIRNYVPALGAVAVALALTGCGKEGTATAPPKPGQAGDQNEKRKLTVKAPTEQNVTQDMTDEFSVGVDRDNFAGPIEVEVRNLPKGVTVVTKEMTIPAGKDSLMVTIKAAPDAPAADDHVVTAVAKAKDMPEAMATFKLDVKPKK